MKYELKNQGFTLIELLVVITLIGILALVAVPDFNDFRARGELESAVDLTKGTLAEAFAQARAQSQTQVVTFSAQAIEFCSVPLDTTVSPVCEITDLPQSVRVTDPQSWRYSAPYGDIEGLSDTLDIELVHNAGDTKLLKLYHRSGLIEQVQ